MKEGETERLRQIDNAANALFAPWLPEVEFGTVPIERFSMMWESKQVWVMADPDDRPAGFAVAGDLDGVYWLDQMAVHRACSGMGLGKALFGAVIEYANWAHYDAAALSTFRDIPFNAPFYEKFGFVAIDSSNAPDPLKQRFLSEIPDGVDDSTRALMIRKL